MKPDKKKGGTPKSAARRSPLAKSSSKPAENKLSESKAASRPKAAAKTAKEPRKPVETKPLETKKDQPKVLAKAPEEKPVKGRLVEKKAAEKKPAKKEPVRKKAATLPRKTRSAPAKAAKRSKAVLPDDAKPVTVQAPARTARAELPKPPEAPREASRAAAAPPPPQAVPESPRPAAPKGPARPRKEFAVPPILLEGDAPAPPPVSGPGTRYALTAEALMPQVTASSGELPESYGTGSLFLAARDPHWLFASWDLSEEQQRAYNRRSLDGHLCLRVFVVGESKPVISEVQVHPESRSWFVNVPHAEKLYYAELGFYDAARNWNSIATSKSTFTPPDSPSPEVARDFATIPPEVTFQQIVQAVQTFVTEHEPLLEAVIKASAAEEVPPTEPVQQELAAFSARQEVTPRETERSQAVIHELPVVEKANGVTPSRSFRAELPVRVERREDWSREQAKAVARLINVDSYRRVWMGSLEITELIRRQLQEEISSIAAAELARGQAEESVTSGEWGEGAPSSHIVPEAAAKAREFWFKVNAELIIYGATEPDATVTIAERPVKLRPDGTFSFRFSLPDGRYQLPAIAISRAGDDGREARLEFSRSTEYHGRVEVHPQDAALRPPKRESIG